MTDKQIIIDGVDVSGCEDYKYDGNCANSAYHLFNFDTKYANCQNRNCYYKQLKRKEQECERLKNERTVDLVKQLNQLKAENENWQKEYWKLEQGNDFWAEKNSRLRGCLTEIKEIAEKIDDSDGCAYGDYDCNNCSSLEQETVCTYKVKKLILQTISECEGNDE